MACSLIEEADLKNAQEQKTEPITGTAQEIKYKASFVQRFYYIFDQRLKIVGESLIDVYQYLIRNVLSIIGVSFAQLSTFFSDPFDKAEAQRTFFEGIASLIKASIGLILLIPIFMTAFLFILIGGTFSAIFGFRNLVQYSLKEQTVIWTPLILLALAAPFLVNEFWLYKLTLVLCFSIIIVGLNFLYGECGIITLGHGGFVLAGGYFASWLGAGTFGITFPLEVSVFLGGAFSFCLGILLGLPSFRVKDYYLVIVTLCFSGAVPLLLKSRYFAQLSGLSEGGGMSIEPMIVPFHIQWLAPQSWVYYRICLISWLMIYSAWIIIRHTQIGRAFRTIKCDQEISLIFGIPVVSFKLLAFAMSGFYAGVAGGALFFLNRFVSPDNFGFHDSLNYIVAIVIGGPGSILGSFLAGGFLAFQDDFARFFSTLFKRGDELTRIFYGVSIILTIYFSPNGIAGKFAAALRAKYSSRIRRGANYISPPADFDYLEAKVRPIKEK